MKFKLTYKKSPYLFHELHALLDETLLAELLGLGQFLADLLGQLVNAVRLDGDFSAQLLLSLGQALLRRLCPSITITDKGL